MDNIIIFLGKSFIIVGLCFLIGMIGCIRLFGHQKNVARPSMNPIKEKQPMTTEKSADSKFVKGLFLTLAWIFATGPVFYAIWVHKWLFFGLIIAGQIGVAINIALKDL